MTEAGMIWPKATTTFRSGRASRSLSSAGASFLIRSGWEAGRRDFRKKQFSSFSVFVLLFPEFLLDQGPLERGEPLDEQLAVEMIDLVAEGPGHDVAALEAA